MNISFEKKWTPFLDLNLCENFVFSKDINIFEIQNIDSKIEFILKFEQTFKVTNIFKKEKEPKRKKNHKRKQQKMKKTKTF